MRPFRDLCEDLFRPLARIDTVDVQKDVVATVFDLLFDRASEGLPRRVPPVTDENGFVTHDVQARIGPSTRRETPDGRVGGGRKAAVPEPFSRAPSSGSFWEGAIKGRNFNGSLQRVPLRRTDRPVIGVGETR